MIWFKKELLIKDISLMGKNTMGEYIGIELIELGTDYLTGRMPVDHRTKQPYGLLHGGGFLCTCRNAW